MVRFARALVDGAKAAGGSSRAGFCRAVSSHTGLTTAAAAEEDVLPYTEREREERGRGR
jgi:hypothetical protein